MKNEYNFPEAKGVVVCGDIHGDFNPLINKVCVRYGITDSIIIVAGDCGFGFERPGYYENIYKRNRDRLAKTNNYLLFVRGNHDNPAYFNESSICHKRFMTLPDYSVVSACGHNILCVGGAVSVDRGWRMDSKFYHQNPEDMFERNVYWCNEAPSYDEEILAEITGKYLIDTVVCHTAPSFCELMSKKGLVRFAQSDETLMEDVENERKVMDKIHTYLKQNGQPLSHWFYGHFHQSWHSDIDGCLFNMLDIMELMELR